ncbi:protein translocase subunit SecD [Alkalilimnicola ehrlichii]|uniref:Protein translocase subunit SecD n=1 Tax=Alkalilimnicola ehrlichii TaxID=351052 RepID=A0A3E0WYG9_9GAMM|nr:protein translocase subunit SecD [Alkalilimnicola ehrlichii]RFA30494.1 protein translocase subunit SecD [Alkalilimnicola ehrlichii]RFA38044.1 protein translocase subunit SecD [Alkalilimnicola ehrlichii]
MMNRYPFWKYLVLLVAIVLGVLYALPNLYGEDPAVQITTVQGEPPSEAVQMRALELLQREGVGVRGAEVEAGQYLVRLNSLDDQLAAQDILRRQLDNHIVALNLAPATPDWLRRFNAEPMYLGLDLRGGVHFLMEVDLESAMTQRLERTVTEFRTRLREQRIRYGAVELEGDRIEIRFAQAPERERAVRYLRNEYRDLEFRQAERGGQFWLFASMTEEAVREMRQYAVQQNITTLRNRVNELGVAEPIIQRQGVDRIVVQLPGVQDTARAKDILGATATLEFRMVHRSDQGDGRIGRVPADGRVYDRRADGQVILERDVMLTGDYIVDAASGLDSETGQPEVNIRLSSAGGSIFRDITQANVGRNMAVVFIETRVETQIVDGEPVRERTRTEEVISVAQIREALGSRFRITGIESSTEARNLALLLRAGALAAPIEIVEERTIGPSMGAENVRQGFMAVAIGFLLVVVFMAVYYKVFGLVANLALFVNLVLIVGILSLLQATLTMPGIAGIVLTVGMAVDANVLIFQRIREELKAGLSPQKAIDSGYGKAFSTIADANITTLIAALVLFVFGTGPIQGFAVTLSIGIVTSMFTAILGTRAVINLIYGRRRRLTKLHI